MWHLGLPIRDAVRAIAPLAGAVVSVAVLALIAVVLVMSVPVLMAGGLTDAGRAHGLRLLRELRAWVTVALSGHAAGGSP